MSSEMTQQRDEVNVNREAGDPGRGPLPYPSHRVIAILADSASAERAVARLSDAGFAKRSIEMFFGEEGIERLKETAAPGGAAGWLLHLVHIFGDDEEQIEQARSALMQGHVLVAVLAPTESEKAMATEIFHTEGSHDMRFFGLWTEEALA
jgi:hypothetical protein